VGKNAGSARHVFNEHWRPVVRDTASATIMSVAAPGPVGTISLMDGSARYLRSPHSRLRSQCSIALCTSLNGHPLRPPYAKPRRLGGRGGRPRFRDVRSPRLGAQKRVGW
jgi:hypothetical protein